MVSHPCNAIVAQALPVVNNEFTEGRKSADEFSKTAILRRHPPTGRIPTHPGGRAWAADNNQQRRQAGKTGLVRSGDYCAKLIRFCEIRQTSRCSKKRSRARTVRVHFTLDGVQLRAQHKRKLQTFCSPFSIPALPSRIEGRGGVRPRKPERVKI